MSSAASHDRLWPVREGNLVSATIAYDADDPHHATAREIGLVLLEAIAGAHSVRLAGSAAIREPHAPAPRDLDLAVLVDDTVARDQAQLRARALVSSWRDRSARPIDVVALSVDALRRDPFVHPGVALQSVCVAGEALGPASLPADWRTAAVLWAGRHREARQLLGMLFRGLEHPDAPAAAIAELVQRIGKRLLRLVAPVALAQLHVYSIDLERCADLIARVLPSAGAAAQSVLRDLRRHDASPAAVERLTQLAMHMLSLDPHVRRMAAGAATTSPIAAVSRGTSP